MKAESGLIWDGNEDISNLELGWQSESGPYFWRTLPFRLWQVFFGGNHTHAWNGNCRCTYIGIDDSSTMVASSHLRQQPKKHALMIEPAQHVNQTTVYPVFCLLLFHHKTGYQLHHYEYTVWLFSIVRMVCLYTNITHVTSCYNHDSAALGLPTSNPQVSVWPSFLQSPERMSRCKSRR
jgi:hypothetical protein